MQPIRVIKTNAPTTASIDTSTNTIEVGSLFMDAPRAARTFIMLHELGHKQHADEFGADNFACRQMLIRGYTVKDCVKILQENLTESAEKDARITNLLTYGG